MESAQSPALVQMAAAWLASWYTQTLATVSPHISHHGPNKDNARTAYGGPQINIDYVNIDPSSSSDSCSQTRYRVPHNVCNPFIGRQKELEVMSSALFSAEKVDGARRFVVFGMGGSGKTQLCLKFAETYRNRFWAVFFVDASTILAADNCFSSIAQKEGHRKPSTQEGVDWLANIQHEWLLIIDNADDLDVKVADYCPPSSNGYILITTRNQSCRRIANVGDLEVGNLKPDDGVTLLLKVAMLPHDNLECRSRALPLVEELGCLALALYHAGATIFEAEYRLDQYLSEYAHVFQKNTAYGRNPEYNPWELSRTAIERMGTEEAKQACEILDIAGLFHFQEIPFALFHCSLLKDHKSGTLFEYLQERLLEASTGARRNELQPYLCDIRDITPVMDQRQNTRYLRPALALLRKYSLISFDKNPDANISSFSMHRLVHQWSRDRLSDRERRWSRCAAAAMLSHAIPPQECRGADAYNDRRRLLPHVNSFLFHTSLPDRTPQKILHEHLDAYQSRVAAKLALVFMEGDHLEKAEQLYRVSLAGLENSLPEYESDQLAVVDNLGVVLERQNRYTEAEKMNRRAIEGRKRILGEDNTLTLESRNNLGVTLNSRGDHVEAEELNRKILQKREEILTPESPYTIDSLHNLALSLNHQARYEEAAELFTRVLDWRERNFGAEHLETIKSLDDLAAALHNEGSVEPAKENYQKALNRRISVLGKSHPDTLMNMSDLALMMLKVGDRDDAKTLSEDAYETITACVGTTAKSYLPFILGTCAQVEEAYRHYKEAEELFREAIKGLEEDNITSTHPDLLNYQLLLSRNLRKQHNYLEADRLYRQVLHGYQQRHSRPSKAEMICLTNLAAVLEKQNKFEEAESAHRKAFYCLSIWSPTHPQTIECLENCARCLCKREKHSEAIEMYYRAVELRKNKCGIGDATTLRNLAELAYILDLQGRFALAWSLYQAACMGFDDASVKNRYAKRCKSRLATLEEKIVLYTRLNRSNSNASLNPLGFSSMRTLKIATVYRDNLNPELPRRLT
ncbi:hypothetical protein F4805DRAFT_29851 [Annulohypoxylon moriforme]|nr:hypothetical protein F4805DRAFT_29851 [Annulohypoxylon moriforme]